MLGPYLFLAGAITLGLYEALGSSRETRCEADPDNPDEMLCEDSSGSKYRGPRNISHGFGFGGGSSSGHLSGQGYSYGGFGHYGSHSGGG